MPTSPNGRPPSSTPDISWPVNRPEDQHKWTRGLEAEVRAREASEVQRTGTNILSREFYPHGKRSLSGIAIRAFGLGLSLGLCSFLALFLLYLQSNFWRAPFFIATLSVFHFLEFWTTAAYNTPVAYISSFLFTNGNQYRIAHTTALIEALITSHYFPQWQSRMSGPWVVLIGLLMITVGQAVRSMAMAQAGTNFNHQVQSKKNEGHE